MLENIHLSGHAGNIDLIDYPHITFLCSRIVPSSHISSILGWAQGFFDNSHCIVCGCQTSIEFQVVKALLINRVPVIIVFSTSIPEMIGEDWRIAVDEGRLLLLSQNENENPTNEAYLERNTLMIELAEQIVVGYCTRGGNIARQVQGRKNVTFLTSYSEYDNSDHTLWSRSHRMSDGGTVFINLHSLNRQSTYLEVSKSFFSTESHKTEYTSIYIPQDDIESINNLLSDALFYQREHKSRLEYSKYCQSHTPKAAEELMPWEDDVRVKIVQMYHEGISKEKIAMNLNVSRDLIDSILGLEA